MKKWLILGWKGEDKGGGEEGDLLEWVRIHSVALRVESPAVAESAWETKSWEKPMLRSCCCFASSSSIAECVWSSVCRFGSETFGRASFDVVFRSYGFFLFFIPYSIFPNSCLINYISFTTETE